LKLTIIMPDGAMSEEKCNMSDQCCSDENSDEDAANSSALKNSTDNSDENAKESDEWNSGDEEEERRKNEEEDKRHVNAFSELRKILFEEDVSMEDKSKIMDEIRVKEEKKAEENLQRQRLKEEKILQREKQKEEQRLKKEQLEIAKQRRIEEKERRMAEKEAQKLKREEEKRIRMEQKKKLEEEKLAEKKKQEEARQKRLLEKQKQEEEKQKEKALREKERQQKQMEKDKLEEEKRQRMMEKEKLENEKARKQEMMQERFKRFFIPVKPTSAEDENKVKDENTVSAMPSNALASNSSFELNNFYASIYAQNIPIESLRCEMKKKQCQLKKSLPMKKDHQSNDSTTPRVYRVKFLQLGFSASKNCPYIGIFNDTSDIITGRTPLGRDWELFDYNQDESDISDACLSEVIGKFVQPTKELLIAEFYFKQDDEESSDSLEINDFFVPADYLSDSERDGDPTLNSQCATAQDKSKEKECSFKDAFGRRVFNKKVEMEIKGPFWDCSDENFPPELSFAKIIAVGPTPVCTSLDLAVVCLFEKSEHLHYFIFVSVLPDLINMVHGSKAGLQKIVDAFIEKCSSMNIDEIPSKRQTEKKIREIAKRELLPGGSTSCWVVSDELVEKYNLPNVREEKPNLKRSLPTSMDSPGTLDRFLQAADEKRQKTIPSVNIL
ncbi:hypothetical protein T07_4706, partial [Trichinella nelsoni]